MLTTDALREYGAAVDEGLARCMNMEQFYLGLVAKAAADTKIGELKEALAAGDLDKAFETAHALKGMLGNLALTPVYDPVNEMTELLRSRTDTDYSVLMGRAEEQFEKLKALV